MERCTETRTAAGHKRVRNRPAERRPAITNDEAARAVVNRIYAAVFMADRIDIMVKQQDERRQQQFGRANEAAAPFQDTQQHDYITIYNGFSGALVTEVREHSSRSARLSYHELYQEARRCLGLPMRATSSSLALVSRYHHAPSQLNAGDIVPAHRGACFADMRGSVVDAIVHP